MKTTHSDIVTRYVISRPVDAYPRLPVHLNRIYLYRDESGALLPTGRSDWIGSYPTTELAEGRAMLLEERA